MTYANLLEKLQKLTVDQLSCYVTVQVVWDDYYYYPAIFRTAGIEHDFLDEDHPIILVED